MEEALLFPWLERRRWPLSGARLSPAGAFSQVTAARPRCRRRLAADDNFQGLRQLRVRHNGIRQEARYDTVLQNFRWSEDFALWETSFLDVSKAAAP